jgi:hypothetical protein
MDQEPERDDRLDKIVQFSEALRFRRSSANASQPMPQAVCGPEDDEPPRAGSNQLMIPIQLMPSGKT